MLPPMVCVFLCFSLIFIDFHRLSFISIFREIIDFHGCPLPFFYCLDATSFLFIFTYVHRFKLREKQVRSRTTAYLNVKKNTHRNSGTNQFVSYTFSRGLCKSYICVTATFANHVSTHGKTCRSTAPGTPI